MQKCAMQYGCEKVQCNLVCENVLENANNQNSEKNIPDGHCQQA